MLAAMIATPIVSAATVQISGPTVISSPGTYVLTQDIATGQSPAISIRCSNVVFDGNGHTIDGTDASGSFGIQVNNGNTPLTGVTVKNVRLTDWYYGLYYKYASSGRIESVRAESNQNAGICLAYANDNVLTGCTATGNEQGILLSFASSRNRIESCTMSSNDDAGLWLASTGRDPNQYDRITYDSTANQVVGNTATGNGRMGLYVDFSAGNTLSSNTVSGNGGYQIFLDYSATNRVESNTVSGGTEQGVYLYDADSCTISGNTVSGVGDYGIYISSTTGLVISGNTLTHNGIGGIALNGEATIPADGNRIVSNTIRDNGQHGIFLCRSSGNTITNNLFSNPVNAVYGGSCTASTWSAQPTAGTSIVGGPTLGGNFWGTPTGTGFSETTADADRNGICDRPFAINSGNSDLQPLSKAPGAGTVTTTAVPTVTTTTATPTLGSTPSPTTIATTAAPVSQAPFPAAHALPCTVEAEQFDVGGEGVAYHDYEAASLGTNTALRPGEGVDIDTEGGITNVGYTRDGEYTKYSVDAGSAGSFSLALRAANPDPAAKAVKVYLDGAPAGQVSVGPTGGWSIYQDFTCSAPIAFPQGRHVVTIAFEGVSRINLDRLAFSAAAQPVATPTSTPTTMTTPPPIGLPSLTPTATPTAQPELQNATLSALPGATNPPRDPNGDGRYEDVNGNGRTDFSDVTLLFTNLNSVTGAYPSQTFDFNGNARIDYGDVTVLYGKL